MGNLLLLKASLATFLAENSLYGHSQIGWYEFVPIHITCANPRSVSQKVRYIAVLRILVQQNSARGMWEELQNRPVESWVCDSVNRWGTRWRGEKTRWHLLAKNPHLTYTAEWFTFSQYSFHQFAPQLLFNFKRKRLGIQIFEKTTYFSRFLKPQNWVQKKWTFRDFFSLFFKLTYW